MYTWLISLRRMAFLFIHAVKRPQDFIILMSQYFRVFMLLALKSSRRKNKSMIVYLKQALFNIGQDNGHGPCPYPRFPGNSRDRGKVGRTFAPAYRARVLPAMGARFPRGRAKFA